MTGAVASALCESERPRTWAKQKAKLLARLNVFLLASAPCARAHKAQI